MQLRLGLVLGFASIAAFIACGDDDTTNPVSPGVDAGSTSSSSGSSGSSSSSSGTSGSPEAGSVDSTWQFQEVEGAFCANGSKTGIGISKGTSKRLTVFLEGGGACWNEAYCYLAPQASNLDGFDKTKFDARIAKVDKSLLDRTAANNPFKDDSFVYIPYCTGDVHSGDKEQKYSPDNARITKHVGRKNIEADLKVIQPLFKDVERVELTGSSAGGFGAALNYWRFKAAFGATRVDLVDDSGPPFPIDVISNWSEWVAAWDLYGNIDPGCTACREGDKADKITELLPYYAKTNTGARFSLLSYDKDPTIRQFFGISPGTFKTTLEEITKAQFDTLPNAKAFEITGETHTMLGDLTTKSGDKELGAWLTDQVSDSATWATVRPAAQ